MSVATLSRAASTAVVLVSLAAALPSPARATTFALGVVSAPTDIPVGNEGLRGLFEDDYTFSIGQGSFLAFSAFLETPPSNRFWIGDLNAELFRGSESLVQGTAESGEIPGGGFPFASVTFAPLPLVAGDYRLRVSGTATGAYEGAFSSIYSGVLSFASVTTPVPEPSTLALMLAGLGLTMWLRGRSPGLEPRTS